MFLCMITPPSFIGVRGFGVPMAFIVVGVVKSWPSTPSLGMGVRVSSNSEGDFLTKPSTGGELSEDCEMSCVRPAEFCIEEGD